MHLVNMVDNGTRQPLCRRPAPPAIQRIFCCCCRCFCSPPLQTSRHSPPLTPPPRIPTMHSTALPRHVGSNVCGVGSDDDYRVAKADPRIAAVMHNSCLQRLRHQLLHVWVCGGKVGKHHAAGWSAAHGGVQQACVVVANVTRGGTDKPGEAGAFGELAAVERDEGA